MDGKTCSTCSLNLPRESFYTHPTSPDGLNSRCKDCVRAGVQRLRDERRANAPEAEKRHTCKRCWKKYTSQEFGKKASQQNVCVYCLKNEQDELTYDARICKECQLSKPIEAFYKQNEARGGYRTRCKQCTIAANSLRARGYL